MAASKNTTAQAYCVVYRTGGTENFRWHRVTVAGGLKTEAEVCKNNLERAGYRAMVVNLAQSLAIGLPETYE